MGPHVAVKIHTFSLASQALGFGMYLRRATKILPFLVRVVRGRRGDHLRLLGYLVCSLRGGAAEAS